MQVQVEFYGIPRARAGVSATTATGNSLGEVLCDLSSRFPLLAETCFEGSHLRSGFTVNLGGDRFVTDPETPLANGDTLLLMTLDVGG